VRIGVRNNLSQMLSLDGGWPKLDLRLKVKRMKGNLSAATLPSAWKGRFELGELLGQGGFGQARIDG